MLNLTTGVQKFGCEQISQLGGQEKQTLWRTIFQLSAILQNKYQLKSSLMIQDYICNLCRQNRLKEFQVKLLKWFSLYRTSNLFQHIGLEIQL